MDKIYNVRFRKKINNFNSRNAPDSTQVATRSLSGGRWSTLCVRVFGRVNGDEIGQNLCWIAGYLLELTFGVIGSIHRKLGSRICQNPFSADLAAKFEFLAARRGRAENRRVDPPISSSDLMKIIICGKSTRLECKTFILTWAAATLNID